jgi:tetratricopeptide (TPR) repeat protein
MTQNNLGNLLSVMGRREEAKVRYEQALELYEELLKSDTANSQFQSYVAMTQNNLGSLLRDMGRLEEAKVRYEQALEMREELLKSDTANSQFQSYVAGTQNNLGNLLRDMGRLEEAKTRYEQALELYEELLKSDTANSQFQSYVATTQNNLGNLLRDTGRLKEAKTRFEHALGLREKLLKSDTANSQFQSYVAGTQNNLGVLLRVMERLEEAKTQYERALELREKLLKTDPANSQFQSDVATTQNNLGNLLSVMGRREEAKTRYEQALELFEKLLKSDTANSLFQSYVAGTQNNLGVLLRVMDRLEEAKTQYERALELVKEQKNQHYTGWTLSLLGELELKRDDPETARTFLESSIGKLNKDIRPDYPNALNSLALCYFKIGERKKKAARQEKRGENARRRQVSESSQFFSLASKRYREAYELPYARMPAELLIDACLADAFASSVQTVSEEDDQRAVELLNESIKKLEKAFEPAKKNEGQRKRVEGVLCDLLAKRSIRSVSLFKGEKEKKKREQLLVEASDNLLRAARIFEELESDKTAASCQGCACLYRGVKKFKDGFLSDKFKLIAEAHEEFKNAASFYKNAESEVGEDVISTINEVVSEMEGSYDEWEGKKPGIADYLSIFDKISNLIEQVSAVGLKNLFKVYVFDEFMNLMDERRMKIKEGNIYAGEVVMGDKFENIRNATIINKSVVENSFNKIRAEQGEGVASALKEIADFIEQQGNREAGELFDRFNEELNKPEPKKSVLKSVWAGIEKAIPVATALAEPVAKLAMLFK